MIPWWMKKVEYQIRSCIIFLASLSLVSGAHANSTTNLRGKNGELMKDELFWLHGFQKSKLHLYAIYKIIISHSCTFASQFN